MRTVLVALASSFVTAAAVVGSVVSGQSDERRPLDVNLVVRGRPLELSMHNDRLKVDVEGHIATDSVLASFEPQLSEGPTSSVRTNGVASHTIQVVVSGTPDACAFRLEGSNDHGAHWFWLSDEAPCLRSTVMFVPNRPVEMVRGFLVTLSGGTGGIAMHYAGR